MKDASRDFVLQLAGEAIQQVVFEVVNDWRKEHVGLEIDELLEEDYVDGRFWQTYNACSAQSSELQIEVSTVRADDGCTPALLIQLTSGSPDDVLREVKIEFDRLEVEVTFRR